MQNSGAHEAPLTPRLRGILNECGLDLSEAARAQTVTDGPLSVDLYPLLDESMFVGNNVEAAVDYAKRISLAPKLEATRDHGRAYVLPEAICKEPLFKASVEKRLFMPGCKSSVTGANSSAMTQQVINNATSAVDSAYANARGTAQRMAGAYGLSIPQYSKTTAAPTIFR